MRYRHAAGGVVLALLLLSSSGCATSRSLGDSSTTVLIVRHAEKLNEPSHDPHLSDTGLLRATMLASVAEDAGVDVVYVTQYQRTKETAAPLAAKAKTPVVVFDMDFSQIAPYVDSVVRRIHDTDAGKVVLIVTHSNTMTPIIERLTGRRLSPVTDSDYSRLYVVTGQRVIAAQYGCQATVSSR